METKGQSTNDNLWQCVRTRKQNVTHLSRDSNGTATEEESREWQQLSKDTEQTSQNKNESKRKRNKQMSSYDRQSKRPGKWSRNILTRQHDKSHIEIKL